MRREKRLVREFPFNPMVIDQRRYDYWKGFISFLPREPLPKKVFTSKIKRIIKEYSDYDN
jgi:hypothetical protein